MQVIILLLEITLDLLLGLATEGLTTGPEVSTWPKLHILNWEWFNPPSHKLSRPTRPGSTPSSGGSSICQHWTHGWGSSGAAGAVRALSWDMPPACRAAASLTTMASWEIPNEQFAKEEKSQIWFTDGHASFVGTCWNLTAGAFRPHSGPRDTGENKSVQGAGLAVAHIVPFA